ncbi:DUF3012 domain-containing protein [Vibrio furnissii]
MDAKPKIDWIENEATTYTKNCIFQYVKIVRVIKSRPCSLFF